MVDRAPQTEVINQTWDHKRFIANMILAVRQGSLKQEELPAKIDLSGKLGQVSDNLLDETMSDERKCERSKWAKVDLDDRLILQKETIVGDEDRVSSVMRLYSFGTKTELPAFLLHTHGSVDKAFSPQDFSSLLRKPKNGGLQALFAITPSVRLLIIRTDTTPILPSDDLLNEFVEKWNKLLDKYSLNSSCENEDEEEAFQTNIDIAFVRNMIYNFNIAFYASVDGTNIYSKAF